MIEVKRYLDRAGADVARTLLESCGIAARVSADNEGGMAPHLTYVTGVRLMVPPADAEAAREILLDAETTAASRRPHLVEASDAILPRGPTDTAYKAALVGLVVFPVGLHLYSLFYVIRGFRIWAKLTPLARRRLVIATAIDAAVLLAGVATIEWVRP